MTDSFPPLNYVLSPHTGWTRAHWEAVLARMTYGYVKAAEISGSPARVLYPDDRRGLPDAVGDCGHVFQSGDAESLATQMLRALDPPAQPSRESIKSHLSVSSFSA